MNRMVLSINPFYRGLFQSPPEIGLFGRKATDPHWIPINTFNDLFPPEQKPIPVTSSGSRSEGSSENSFIILRSRCGDSPERISPSHFSE